MTVRLYWTYADGAKRVDLGLFETEADAEAAKPQALSDLLSRAEGEDGGGNGGDDQMHAGQFEIAPA